MPEALLVLVCVMAAVIVVGHGLWVAIAWFLKGFNDPIDQPRPERALVGTICPRCGLTLEAGHCSACDWPQQFDLARKRPLAALDGLAAQIEKFSRLAMLEPPAINQFFKLISAERQRLAEVNLTEARVKTAPEPILMAELVEDAIAAVQRPVPEPIIAAIAAVEADHREFVSEVPPEIRAARFMNRQEPPVATVAPPAPPRASLSDWLSAFMEERNIRWGELIGGLLIVCGSLALVVSFWSTIAERPLLKFLLFNGVTAGLFGVGFYSEHRWRLHTTSQGLLIIASLLVPLNFLAIAAFSRTDAADTALTIAGEAISLGLFAALVYWAGKVIVQPQALALAGGVLVPALAQLLVRRYVDPLSSVPELVALASLPAACYLVANGWALQHAARAELDEERVNVLFKFLGITTFAALLPLALLLVDTERPLDALRHMPMLLSLLGLVPLSVGLFLWQRLADREMSNLRLAGTSVAVFGAIVSLSGLALGWPDPRAMLTTGIVDFAVFTFVAWRFALPMAHLVAAACATCSFVLGVYLAQRRIAWFDQDGRLLAETIVSGSTGTILAPLVLAYAAAAYGALRTKSAAAPAFGLVAVLLAGLSVALVSWFGLGVEGDPFGAAWVYLLYAAGCLAVGARTDRVVVAWVGAVVLLAAVVQGVMFRYAGHLSLVHGEVDVILIYASLCVAIVRGITWLHLKIDDSDLDGVLWDAGFFTSLAAAAWLLVLAPSQSATFEGGHWLWFAAIWLVMTLRTGYQPIWTLFQFALSLAAVFGAVSQLETRDWFIESARPWLDPWTWQAVGITLALLNLCWAIVRMLARRNANAIALLQSPWLSVDRVTTGALIPLLVVIGTYAALPGVRQELSPRLMSPGSVVTADGIASPAPLPRFVPPIAQFEILGIPHDHASGPGTWMLLAIMLVLLAAMVREGGSPPWLLSLFVVAAVCCPLLASSWESEVAVASALRWFSAGLLLLGSVPIWFRDGVAKHTIRQGWQQAESDFDVVVYARSLVFILGLLPPVAMAIDVGMGALARSPRLGELWSDSYALSIVFGVAVLAAGGFWFAPVSTARRNQGQSRPTWPLAASALVLVLGTAPIVSVVLYHVGIALKQSPILGADPSSIFFRMGLAGSYAAPVLMTAVALVGYAIRERSSGFALAGGLVLNAGATAAYLLAISKGGLLFDATQWIRLAQLNAAVASIYTLAWIATLRRAARSRSPDEPIAEDFLFHTQVGLAPALMVLTLGWAWCKLVLDPDGDASQTYVINPELADPVGWMSLALAVASICGATWCAKRRVSMAGISAGLVALAVFAAVLAAPWDLVGNWVSYNTLFVGHMVIATALLAIAWREQQLGLRPHELAGSVLEEQRVAEPIRAWWVELQYVLILFLGVRELIDNRWWPAAGFFALTALAAGMAWVFQRRRYLYAAAITFSVAGSLVWIESKAWPGFDSLLYFNVILLALPVVPWMLIELKSIRRRPFRARLQVTPMHHVATRGALAALTILVGLGLYADATQTHFSGQTEWLNWAALAIAAVAAVACLWDAAVKDALARLYFLGLIAVGMLLDQFDLPLDSLLWTGNMVLAAYALLTSYLWSRRDALLGIAQRLQIPQSTVALSGLTWLVPLNVFVVSCVVLLTGIVELTNQNVPLRILAAQATLTQVVSLALLAHGDRRHGLQSLALQLGAVAAAMFGWAWLQVGTTLTMLHALVVLAAALAAVAGVYGFGLGKVLRDTSDWLAPARRLTPWLAGLCMASLVAILGVEVVEFSQDGVEIAWPAIVAVGVTLAALAVAALAAAVLPGRDPLGLSERGRTLYVYAAETILAFLFVHIRITMPWLFSGFFQQFWPLVVMGLAFLGVGFAEYCRRRKQDVLAEPIENTGALLPVLPVLGFWASETHVNYSLLLLSVGVLYAGLSVARRSFGFGILAALAANGGLWYFFNQQEGFGFLAHPQIWLIPPALCVLIAAYLNRDQLSGAQMTAVRYGTSMSIYISSTADIFLNGVTQAPWLPLVLGGLSIAGILAGIVLRARAFLFLGTSFLGLALFTIIWHAAVDLEQTWIWYASTVVAGVLIMTLVGIFEKKRQEVLEVVEKLKLWEG